MSSEVEQGPLGQSYVIEATAETKTRSIGTQTHECVQTTRLQTEMGPLSFLVPGPARNILIFSCPPVKNIRSDGRPPAVRVTSLCALAQPVDLF